MATFCHSNYQWQYLSLISPCLAGPYLKPTPTATSLYTGTNINL